MTNRLTRAALAACLILAGCCGPDAQRVKADQATYAWFAPMFAAYVTGDATLDQAAKATHLRGLDAWKARLDADAAAVK